MNPYETYQQSPQSNPQQHWAGTFPQQQPGQIFGQQQGFPGQAAYGQQPYGGQQFGQPGSMGQAWGQQRQLSQHEVGEVVRQLIPLLPQILAQAQLPQTGIGYGAYGQAPRTLTQQDVTEVARQILSIAPQIAAMSQAPWQQAGPFGGAGQGFPQQQPYGQQGFLPFQAAFGSQMGQPQRQLT